MAARASVVPASCARPVRRDIQDPSRAGLPLETPFPTPKKGPVRAASARGERLELQAGCCRSSGACRYFPEARHARLDGSHCTVTMPALFGAVSARARKLRAC